MQIVIDISEENYDSIKRQVAEGITNPLKICIVNGTPLVEMLNEMKDEFISLYPKNYAGEPELGGSSCKFSLNQILKIIDKYM